MHPATRRVHVQQPCRTLDDGRQAVAAAVPIALRAASAHPPVAPVLQAVQGSDAMAQHTPPPSAAVSPVPPPEEPLPPEDPVLLVGVGSVPMKRPPHAPTASPTSITAKPRRTTSVRVAHQAQFAEGQPGERPRSPERRASTAAPPTLASARTLVEALGNGGSPTRNTDPFTTSPRGRPSVSESDSACERPASSSRAWRRAGSPCRWTR